MFVGSRSSDLPNRRNVGSYDISGVDVPALGDNVYV